MRVTIGQSSVRVSIISRTNSDGSQILNDKIFLKLSSPSRIANISVGVKYVCSAPDLSEKLLILKSLEIGALSDSSSHNTYDDREMLLCQVAILVQAGMFVMIFIFFPFALSFSKIFT